jgi:hypothetical protein
MNIWLRCLPLLVCTGCGRAPSIDIIGSFLPSWMFCIAAAVIAAGVVRWQLVRHHLEHEIPALAVFYPSLAIALACFFWLILFA